MTAVLYILMRTDLDSLGAGKAMAQASHASNAFVDHYHSHTRDLSLNTERTEMQVKNAKGFTEWEHSTTQGFGTVLVLGGSINDISDATEMLRSYGYVAGILHDPTYPIIDGEVVHCIPLDTCAYIFVPDKEEDKIAPILLKKFSLHP